MILMMMTTILMIMIELKVILVIIMIVANGDYTDHDSPEEYFGPSRTKSAESCYLFLLKKLHRRCSTRF